MALIGIFFKLISIYKKQILIKLKNRQKKTLSRFIENGEVKCQLLII